MNQSNKQQLLDIIKYEDYDDIDLLLYVVNNSITVPDKKLLLLYTETPNNNISELARALNSSNYIVKKEINRIKQVVVDEFNKLKNL